MLLVVVVEEVLGVVWCGLIVAVVAVVTVFEGVCGFSWLFCSKFWLLVRFLFRFVTLLFEAFKAFCCFRQDRSFLRYSSKRKRVIDSFPVATASIRREDWSSKVVVVASMLAVNIRNSSISVLLLSTLL